VTLSVNPHPRSLSHWERDDHDFIGVWVRAKATIKRPWGTRQTYEHARKPWFPLLGKEGIKGRLRMMQAPTSL